ncbi:40S ribosomal protein S15-like [Podarcis raffonei]|uniref:40S ribosomal protein S15-like n=1 Tax=Podarcis raffonei TaxID=65483 RepID=UPI00232976AE|nr:40S ribosomal protein S15-like [Podarcis raffonei]
MAEVKQKKKCTFWKFTYWGVDLDQLLDMSYEQLIQLYKPHCRQLNRGLRRKQHSLLKKEALPMEKPEVVKTHLRVMIILPEMVRSMVGVYNGKTFNQVEIKPEVIGHNLGEFSITYKPVKHGRPGIGATHSSRFIPLK